MTYEQTVYDFLNEELAADFPELNQKIIFKNEHKDAVTAPFLQLIEKEDSVRHLAREKDGIITEYRRVCLTLSVCYDSNESGTFSCANKYRAKDVINFIRAVLNRNSTGIYFTEKTMDNRPELLSGNRDMTKPSDTGFIYMYEFDAYFDYEVQTSFVGKVAEGVCGVIENVNDGFEIKLDVEKKEKNIENR